MTSSLFSSIVGSMTTAEVSSRHQLQRHDPHRATLPSKADHSFCQNSSEAANPAESVSLPRLNSTGQAAQGRPWRRTQTTAPYRLIVLMERSCPGRCSCRLLVFTETSCWTKQGRKTKTTSMFLNLGIKSMKYLAFHCLFWQYVLTCKHLLRGMVTEQGQQ